MRLLVIEHFTEERPERQRLWDGLIKKFDQQLELHFCRQEKDRGFLLEADGTPFQLAGYDVVFIHAGDKQYSPSENYVDLAKTKQKAFVCYSGGAEEVVAPRLRELQIDEMPLGVFSQNIGLFLERLAGDRGVTPEAFYLLADFDPRLEAAYNLLQMFLPLDLALQLQDLEECKAQAAFLIKNKDKAAGLLRQALGAARPSQERIEDAHLEDDDDPRGLLNSLWACAENLQAADEPRRFAGVCGDASGSSSSQHGPAEAPGSTKRNFHRTFEKLRDALFKLTQKGE